VNGEDIQSIPVTELRRRMGYVIQQIGLFPHMTVAQNIAIVPELLKWPRTRIDARIDELLVLVNMPVEFRSRYPSQISGGQQQRVGLARALAADPEILLMDEPFGAIDAINRYRLQEELIQLQNRLHKTILFVTHDVDEALRLADRIAVLRAGRLIQYAEPCNLLNRPKDDFVRELLNADDRIRQLSLLPLESVLVPIGDDKVIDGVPRLESKRDLREALSILLQPGVSRVIITDENRVVGQVTLDTIRHAGCE
jgi:osmoprotectant transport system ATP-binding protein